MLTFVNVMDCLMFTKLIDATSCLENSLVRRLHPWVCKTNGDTCDKSNRKIGRFGYKLELKLLRIYALDRKLSLNSKYRGEFHKTA